LEEWEDEGLGLEKFQFSRFGKSEYGNQGETTGFKREFSNGARGGEL